MHLDGHEDDDGAHRPSVDVFVTYNSEDEAARPLVDAVVAALDRAGRRPWYAPRDKIAGVRSDKLMSDAVAASTSCAIFWGAKGAGPWQDRYELPLATDRAVKDESYRLYAVLLPGADPSAMPEGLSIHSYVDLRQHFAGDSLTDNGQREILAAVKGVPTYELEKALTRSSEELAEEPRRRALLIGVSTYDDDGFPDLHGPRNDVAQLANELARSSAPLRWDVEPPVTDPDYVTFGRRVKGFLAKVRPQDTVLVYYSGHGTVERGTSHLAARDTVRNQLDWSGVQVAKLVRQLEGSPAAARVLILDCCHAAPLAEADPYPDVDGTLAIIAASHGLADDAGAPSDPSPFTGQLIRSLRDATGREGDALTVGGLLAELAGRGVATWSNPHRAQDIKLIASSGARSPSAPVPRLPELSVVVRPECLASDRLDLVRQLGETLDALLAMTGNERDVPAAVVRRTVLMIAQELGRSVLSDDQMEQLSALSPNDSGKFRLALRFPDPDVRAKTADLPWEYLAFFGIDTAHAVPAGDGLSAARAPVERLFGTSGTKSADEAQVQAVALLSSLEPSSTGPAHVMAAAATEQFRTLGLETEPTTHVTWGLFSGSPNTADLMVLQVPLTWDEGEAKALFKPTRPDDGPKPVRAHDVATVLQNRSALTRVFIETLADTSRAATAAALRRFADDLARQLGRPVVGVCHARAYASAVTETPAATSFVPHVVQQLKNRVSLEVAAHSARLRVASTLAASEPAIVGIPVVVRPEREESPPKGVPVPSR